MGSEGLSVGGAVANRADATKGAFLRDRLREPREHCDIPFRRPVVTHRYGAPPNLVNHVILARVGRGTRPEPRCTGMRIGVGTRDLHSVKCVLRTPGMYCRDARAS